MNTDHWHRKLHKQRNANLKDLQRFTKHGPG